MLTFCDSFDGYTDYTQKGWQLSSGGPAISTAVKRTGIQSFRFAGSGPNTAVVHRNAPAAVASMAMGFAWYRTAGIDTAQSWVDVVNAADGVTHLRLGIDASNHLTVFRGAGTTLLGTGTTSVPVNAWVYIEFKFTVDDTTGVAVVRLNEAVEINLSGIDTRNGGTVAAADRITYRQDQNGGGVNYMDDYYLLDTTTGTPNDFLGDIKVECLLPNGNGNSSQLVGSDGNSTDNYLLVDEASPNSDTDYVESSTVGNKDTYAYGNLAATSGTVHGLQINTFAEKTDAGARTIASVARVSATEEDSADFTLLSTYQMFSDQRVTKPGGGAWSISDVNGAEFGVKVTA